MFLFLLSFVLKSTAVDICLPPVHESFVSTRRDIEWESPMSHHTDEFYEHDFIHIWFDSSTRKSLVHIYEEEYYRHQEEDHYMFGLRDYNRKYHWHGHWNSTTRTVTHCQLELWNEPFAVYCPVKGATLKGSGTVGQNNKVDFYQARYDSPDRKFFEDIHLITEAGSTSVMMQERVFGEHFNETEQRLYTWVETREWYDTSLAAIDPSVFNVPVGCPNPQ